MSTVADSIKLGTYRHYKGMTYRVLGVARHSEDQELFVVYEALYGDHELWARPVRMFMECVIKNGMEVPRFQYVDGEH